MWVREAFSPSAVCLFDLLIGSLTGQTLETQAFCLSPEHTASAPVPSHLETPFEVAFRTLGRPPPAPCVARCSQGGGGDSVHRTGFRSRPGAEPTPPWVSTQRWEPVPGLPVPECQWPSVWPKSIPALPIINRSTGPCRHVQGGPLQPTAATTEPWEACGMHPLLSSLEPAYEVDARQVWARGLRHTAGTRRQVRAPH